MDDNQDQNELIRAARSLLGEEPKEVPAEVPVVIERPAVPETLTRIPENSAEIVGTLQPVQYMEQPQPTIAATVFQKFGDLPTQLRENQGINLIEVKRLNLAAMVEALERSMTAHESFPSPDNGMAVSQISEQIMKLTKDIEKSHDPKKILDDLVDNALSKLTQEIVQDLAMEMRKLREDTMNLVRVEKQETFDLAFKNAVNRMGPALKDRLEITISRIARILNVKEKPDDRPAG